MQLEFSGWFQCRLATDPDPSDEPRGVSGWTYALAGEPDLDRRIRTQPHGATPRTFGPTIGVKVETVAIDGRAIENHPLRGAPLALLSDAVFEGRNGIAFEDAEEPIFPFHFRIEGGGIRLERELRDLDTNAFRLQKPSGFERNVRAMKKAGIESPSDALSLRKRLLAERRDKTTDQLERLQIETRLRHLEARGFGVVPMPVGLRYRFALQGPWFVVEDSNESLAGMIDSSPWLFSLWTGCWDADALCGFMTGALVLPFRPARLASSTPRPTI